MPRNTSVYLGDHFTQFIEEQVRSGCYSSASDVIRVSFRLLEAEEAQLAALCAALIEGKESGAPHALDLDEFFEPQRTGARG